MKTIPATIHATLAIGSSTTAPYYDVNIEQVLCSSACADETPVFLPTFSVLDIANVGTSQYIVTIHVEGAINYVPCGCGCCQTKSQVLSQNFTILVFSATAITGATIVTGATRNEIVKSPCRMCSKTLVSDTPLTITITT